MDIQRLRRETAAEHAAVEGSIPLMQENLDRGSYLLCLERIYGVVAAWEEKSAGIAPEWMHSMLASWQRKEMLERDLTWFGVIERGHQRPALPEMKDEAGLLGAMYVMEGSTLGGQLISLHVVKALGLTDGWGNAFFRGHCERTGTMWKEFCEVLRTRVPDSETQAAIDGAKAMFRVFGSWMQHEVNDTDLYSPTLTGTIQSKRYDLTREKHLIDENVRSLRLRLVK